MESSFKKSQKFSNIPCSQTYNEKCTPEFLLFFFCSTFIMAERDYQRGTVVVVLQWRRGSTQSYSSCTSLHYTAEQSLAEPGSIPLESRQWLFPFKAATFSTVLGGKEKMANSKGGITYRVCFSLCSPMYYMYVLCFSISQPNACTLAFTFPPLGSMCVCTYTHTHTHTHTHIGAHCMSPYKLHVQ